MKPNDMDANRPNDPLERSIAALQNAPIPNGPNIQTAHNTLAALRGADAQFQLRSNSVISPKILHKVFTMMIQHKKIAASVLLAFGALAAVLTLTVLGSVSYAQVAEKLRSMHSMTCTATMTLPNMKLPIVSKMYYLDPGHTRIEGPFDQIMITDASTDDLLALNTAARTATLIKQAGGVVPIPTSDIASAFRSFGDQKGVPTDDMEIGNVKAKGFRTTDKGRSMSVWADPKTGEPLRIEMNSVMAGAPTQTVLTDIVFDSKLDPNLFSLVPPAGYQATTQHLPTVNGANAMSLEDHVVRVLKAYAAASDGNFPPFLDDPAIIAKITKVDADGKPDADFLKTAQSIGSLTGGLFSYEKGKTYDYLPGAKLGEGDKLVFWRKDPTSGKYVAVFGDMTTRPVLETEIPRK